MRPAKAANDAADAGSGAAADAAEANAAAQGGSAAPSKDRSLEALGAVVTKRHATDYAMKQGKATDRRNSTGVYGFQEKSKTPAKRAIALKLEPLGPGVPVFERVLSEERQSVTIGSNRKSVDVLVSDDAISKMHCTIALVGINNELALSIIDNSTNGTFVNGERLREKGKRYRLRSGDKLVMKNPSVDEEYGWSCDFGNTVAFFSR
jgi:hypothetical protein